MVVAETRGVVRQTSENSDRSKCQLPNPATGIPCMSDLWLARASESGMPWSQIEIERAVKFNCASDRDSPVVQHR